MKYTILILTFFMTFSLALAANASTIFYEDFDGNGPGFEAWSTIAGAVGNGMTWSLMTPGPGSRDWANRTAGEGQYAGNNSMDRVVGWNSILISPVIDISMYYDITISSAVNFQSNRAWDDGYVSYSVDGGGWVELAHWDGVDHAFMGGTVESWMIPNGGSALQVAFRYTTGTVYRPLFFQVDNFEVSGQPVPVPGAFWLLGSGLLGLIGARKRR